MMLALGDALHYQFQKRKNFSIKEFGKLHPGGNIGAKFIKIKKECINHQKFHYQIIKQI